MLFTTQRRAPSRLPRALPWRLPPPGAMDPPMDPLAALLSERPPQQLSATELRARIPMLEDAAKA